ncbi:cGMP-dependent protein kinase 2 [Mauremys reevesii]|uniref:cGMP-dependent protein kinase 2 n=1 Tax=Mauremys reevesii TaxID=260615 RepID=UPI00193FEB8E|nr:cGMP-dependent protein kinase 2 [Mauremys reevesii]
MDLGGFWSTVIYESEASFAAQVLGSVDHGGFTSPILTGPQTLLKGTLSRHSPSEKKLITDALSEEIVPSADPRYSGMYYGRTNQQGSYILKQGDPGNHISVLAVISACGETRDVLLCFSFELCDVAQLHCMVS